MATETELERMVVRLVGDATSYQKMLKEAGLATKEGAKITEKAATKMERLQKSLDKTGASFKRMGAAMSKMGRSMSMYVTAPVIALGTASVLAFSKFDKAMTESTSIMGDLSESTRGLMREQALMMSTSGQGAQSATDLAEAYFFLASAGKSAEQSMALLPQVMDFATAGAFDMALATDLLTDAQSALGLSFKDAAKDAESMGHVADVFVKANTLANTSVQQISEAITNQAGAAFKAYNKSIEEGTALLAAYADQGIKGNVAGSMSSRVLLLLSKSAQEAGKAHRELGFRVYDNTGKMRNMADIIQNLEQITAGMSDRTKAATLTQLGFQARVQQAILPLMGTSEQIRYYQQELEKAGGITKEVAEKQMKSFSAQMKVLKNKVAEVAIEIGKSLVPLMEKARGTIERLLNSWHNLTESQKQNLIKWAMIAATIGPALILLGAASSAIGGLIPLIGGLTTAIMFLTANPIILGLTAVAAALVLVYVNLKKLHAEEARGLPIALQAGKAGAAYHEQQKKNIRALEALAKKTVLTNDEQAEAKRLIENLQGAYAGLDLHLDSTTRKIMGLDDALDDIAEREENTKLLNLENQLKEVDGVFKKLFDHTKSWRFQFKTQAARDEIWALVEEASEASANIREQIDNVKAGRVTRVAAKGKPKRESKSVSVNPGDAAFAIGEQVGNVSNMIGSLYARASGHANKFWKEHEDRVEATQKQTKRGMSLIEKHLTPKQRLDKTRKELTSLLGVGAIDQGTFDRAMSEAVKQSKVVDKVDIPVRLDMRDAAIMGGAEAMGRINSQVSAIREWRTGAKKGTGGPEDIANDFVPGGNLFPGGGNKPGGDPIGPKIDTTNDLLAQFLDRAPTIENADI